jgi:GntR family transcriptional regulator/MocR family aminotransferase
MNRSNGECLQESKNLSKNLPPPAPPAPGGSDFLQLDAGHAPPGGLADWLSAQLRLAISDGRLPVGSRLPATRVLATDLGVSRGVVTEAYRCLAEDGHVAGRGRRGTVVVAAPLTAPPPPPPSAPVVLATPAINRTPGVDIFETLRATPARIDLTPGVPDLTAFPRAAWLRAERAVLDALTPADFGYGEARGTPALRIAVASWLARNRGIRADPDEILIVAGVAQALTVLAQELPRHGIGEVAVEDPGSLGARLQFSDRGIRTPPVSMDRHGIRVDELRATGAPAILLTPAHQFPTGVVLGGERRRALMRWAAEDPGRRLIIEDDYDAEHRYDRPPVPALRAMLPEGVCYTGSVSKLLAPALRVGWMLPPPRLLAPLIDAKRAADLGNAALPQLVLAHLMESGALERHLRALRRRHLRRRDAMIGAIREHLPGATVHGAAAGLHLTITFDDPGLSDTALATAALARGVKCHPLSWHAQRPHPPGLVLGYAASGTADIAEAVTALGAALREVRP